MKSVAGVLALAKPISTSWLLECDQIRGETTVKQSFWHYSCLVILMTLVGLSTNQCLGQTAIWLGGNGAYHSTNGWSGGVVPNGINFDVFIDGGNGTNSVVTGSVNTNTEVDTLTIDAGDRLILSNNSNFTVGSLIDNNGDLELTSLGNATDLLIPNDVDLLGNGNLILTNAATRVFGGGHLINSGNTIQGFGAAGCQHIANHKRIGRDHHSQRFGRDSDD